MRIADDHCLMILFCIETTVSECVPLWYDCMKQKRLANRYFRDYCTSFVGMKFAWLLLERFQ